MGSNPTTTNSQAALGASVVSGVFGAVESIAIDAIIADVPILGAPGLKQLLTLIIDYIGGKFNSGVSQLVVDGTIELQIKSEDAKLQAATAELQAAHQSGDPNVISQSQTDFENAFANLGHFDGSVQH